MKKEDLNLSDLNLKKLKLTEEDALALSYLTPGLSRRIQKQLFAQLPPSEARKLSRTLSLRNSSENHRFVPETPVERFERRSVDRISSSLKRYGSASASTEDERNIRGRFRSTDRKISDDDSKSTRSNLSRKSPTREYSNILNHDYQNVNHNDEYFKTDRPYCTENNRSDTNYDYNSFGSESSCLSKYLSPTRYSSLPDTENKNDLNKRYTSPKRISRFLRPDFFEAPKEANAFEKEKREREMETQKVLKEIRDKRIKNRLNLRRERSASREAEKSTNEEQNKITENSKTVNLLDEVSNNIKNLEENVQNIHDYVNVPAENVLKEADVIKKERPSKLIRPKSYPAENCVSAPVAEKESKSKIGKLKKGFTSQKHKEESKESNKAKNESEKVPTKNKFLHSIEKKFEKLRSLNHSSDNKVSDSNKGALDENKSNVENTIKRLREQSLPRNIDHCITESGLIKRAVSVEDLSTLTSTKNLQPSRKSVTKILNLFKKYEERENKKNDVVKTKKVKEGGEVKTSKNKISQLNSEKTDKDSGKTKGADTVISKNSDLRSKNLDDTPKNKLKELKNTKNENERKEIRPKSLLMEHVKRFQNSYAGAKSDTVINDTLNNDKDLQTKGSKLPVNSFRRSLNLENSQIEPPKFYKNPAIKINSQTVKTNEDLLKSDVNGINELTDTKKPDRKNLKLDFTRIPANAEPKILIEPSTSLVDAVQDTKNNRNSIATTDDSSAFLSPCDDNMSCDSWSVCSDFHSQDLSSPVSPGGGHMYSGDENESVIDRIRRKSFYSRFNEKKKPRKSSLVGNYKDTDFYKDIEQRNLGYKSPTDYGSKDYKSLNRRSSSVTPTERNNYKAYTRSSSLLNDGYINLANRYQTYNPRLDRRINSLCSSDSEETNNLDDVLATGKSRMYSYHNHPSIYGNKSRVASPLGEHSYVNLTAPTLNKASTNSPTSHNPT